MLPSAVVTGKHSQGSPCSLQAIKKLLFYFSNYIFICSVLQTSDTLFFTVIIYNYSCTYKESGWWWGCSGLFSMKFLCACLCGFHGRTKTQCLKCARVFRIHFKIFLFIVYSSASNNKRHCVWRSCIPKHKSRHISRMMLLPRERCSIHRNPPFHCLIYSSLFASQL